MITTITVIRLKAVRDSIRALTYAEMMELAEEVRFDLVESGAVSDDYISTHEVANALSYAARDREYGPDLKPSYVELEQTDGAA